jgi:DNA processing protein
MTAGGRRPRVAVIGARTSTRYGEHVAADLEARFTARGPCVVSTFPYGIDGAALRGGLAARGRVLGAACR